MKNPIRASLTCACVALAFSTTAAFAQQLDYTHTALIHGFGSNSGIWLAPFPGLGGTSAKNYLGARVDLGTVWHPTWVDSTTFTTEFNNVRDTILQSAGGSRHVLVGHSLGALVSRYTYVNGGQTVRDRTAAILAVAPPHQGAILADSALKLGAYMLDLKQKAQEASDWAHGTVLGMFTGWLGLLALIWTNFPTIQVPTQLANVATIPALRTNSAVVINLNQQTPDVSIPRANIVAKLENNTFAALRLAAALKGTTEQQEIDEYRKNRSKLNSCMVVGAFFIITTPAAVKCQQAERVLGKLDEMWLRYSNGSTQQQKCAWIFDSQSPSGQTYRCWNYQATNTTRAMDGVVPNDMSAYPGQGSGDFSQATVVGPNHMSVYRRPEGLDAMVAAMRDQFRMRQPPGGGSGGGSMTAQLIGPTAIGDGESGTWEATASNATEPLSCQWTVNYSPAQTGPCTLNFTFPTPQTHNPIEVVVTDATGLTAPASLTIWVYTAGCVPPNCYESVRVPGGPRAPKAGRPPRPTIRAGRPGDRSILR